jgi:hypothetical protein
MRAEAKGVTMSFWFMCLRQPFSLLFALLSIGFFGDCISIGIKIDRDEIAIFPFWFRKDGVQRF